MNDLMVLATTAATMLAGGTVNALVDESGRSLLNVARKLQNIVRLRFNGDPRAEWALEQVTVRPVEEGAVDVLAAHINRFASADPDFRERLSDLGLSVGVVEQPSFQTDVSGQATVGKIVNIGKADRVEF